jgi:hypothetical protein
MERIKSTNPFCSGRCLGAESADLCSCSAVFAFYRYYWWHTPEKAVVRQL